MELKNIEPTNILEKLKKSLIEDDKVKALHYAEIYEKLRDVNSTLFSGMRQVFLYLKDYKKARWYYHDEINPYELGRFYFYFGEYDKAAEEFTKWANKKNEPGAENNLLIQLLFVQGEYERLVSFMEKSFNSNSYLQSYLFKLLTISLINLSKNTTFVEFESYFKKNHINLYELVCRRTQLQTLFLKYSHFSNTTELEKIKTGLCSFPGISLKKIIPEINYFIEYGNKKGILLIDIYENDPIMKRIKERFTPYKEVRNAFHIFDKIVSREIKSEPKYVTKYQLDGLIDYYLLSENFSEALKLVRIKDSKGVYGFLLLINLLLITENDITAADFVDWQLLFLGKPLSKLVLGIKDDFINFVDERINLIKKKEGGKFIDFLKKGFINISPDYLQNPTLLSGIGSTYNTIYESSPLFKSIKNKKIIWATIDLGEKGGTCCQKYFKNIENEFRESLGIRFKEFGSESEATVYYFVKKVLSSMNIILQYSPEWLKPQKIDLFIEELNLAIEYQGQQHFYPIEYFGGKEAFKVVRENDKRKLELIKAMGVNLEYITYNENIEIRVNEIIKKYWREYV